MKFATLALIGSINAVTVSQLASSEDSKVVNGKYWFCNPPLPNTEEQLNIELDFFSRKFDKTHYNNAMEIYKELLKAGKKPRLSVHSW